MHNVCSGYRFVRLLSDFHKIIELVLDFFFQLVLEGVQARQLRDALLRDKQTMEKALQQAKESVDFYDLKAARIEDQVISFKIK